MPIGLPPPPPIAGMPKPPKVATSIQACDTGGLTTCTGALAVCAATPPTAASAAVPKRTREAIVILMRTSLAG